MKIDADDSGQISVEEWIIWWLRRVSCLPNPLKQQEAIAKNTFQKFDSDNSGSLDASELHALISSLGETKFHQLLTENLTLPKIQCICLILIFQFCFLCLQQQVQETKKDFDLFSTFE